MISENYQRIVAAHACKANLDWLTVGDASIPESTVNTLPNEGITDEFDVFEVVHTYCGRGDKSVRETGERVDNMTILIHLHCSILYVPWPQRKLSRCNCELRSLFN